MKLNDIFKGVILALSLSLVAVILLSIAARVLNISDTTINTFVLLISALSVFVASVVLAGYTKCNGMINGIFLAVIYCAMLFVLSVVINGGIRADIHTFLRFTVSVVSAMAGGVIGVNSIK